MFNKTRTKVRSFCKVTKMRAKKHAPEILVVAGIVATGAAIVTACKATMKVNKIVEEHHENLSKVNTSVEEKKTFVDDDGKEKAYTKEVAKMDKFVCYRDTTFKFIKNYAIPAGLFIIGMTCFVTSTVILKKREKAALALFNGSLAAFNAYRGRVQEEIGTEAENKIYHGIEENPYTELKADGTKEDKILRTAGVSHNVYTFVMNSQTCKFWENDMKYNLILAQSVQEEVHDRVFNQFGGEPIELNYALKKLGMLKCGAMMGEGWVPEEFGGRVKCVDFGLKKYKLSDDKGGIDINTCDEIVLEFNCEHIMDKF